MGQVYLFFGVFYGMIYFGFYFNGYLGNGYGFIQLFFLKIGVVLFQIFGYGFMGYDIYLFFGNGFYNMMGYVFFQIYGLQSIFYFYLYVLL